MAANKSDFLQALVAALRPLEKIADALPAEIPNHWVMMQIDVPGSTPAKLYASDLRRLGIILAQQNVQSDEPPVGADDTQPYFPTLGDA